jgi:hypothetical protein
MRPGAFLAALFLSAASPVLAQTAKAVGPRIEVEPSEHDFGSARQDQKLVHDFVVRNTGDADLELLKIATSCGCAAALPEERVVPPGGSTILAVTLETRKYKGAIERSISVASNDRRQRVSTVKVRAFVEVSEP